ncbi:hypothetical protein CR513_17816, partial [Mucuna pruriens]
MENSSKRTKIYASKTYSLSSHPNMLVDCLKYNLTLPLARLIGQKVAKRKSNGKKKNIMEKIVEAKEIKNIVKAKEIKNIVKAKEIEDIRMLYEILMEDTSMMFVSQHQDYELHYKSIRRKLGN